MAFCLWITAVAVIGVGVGIPATLLLTVLVRWLADRHREWATNRLGEPIGRPHRPAPPGPWWTRLRAPLQDPATWRDWLWLAVNSVVSWFTAGLSFLFFLVGVFVEEAGAEGVVSILVSDDGRGGADIDAGTGLRGIQRRLAAFDGTLVVVSPAGGPTEVRMSLPCALS